MMQNKIQDPIDKAIPISFANNIKSSASPEPHTTESTTGSSQNTVKSACSAAWINILFMDKVGQKLALRL